MLCEEDVGARPRFDSGVSAVCGPEMSEFGNSLCPLWLLFLSQIALLSYGWKSGGEPDSLGGGLPLGRCSPFYRPCASFQVIERRASGHHVTFRDKCNTSLHHYLLLLNYKLTDFPRQLVLPPENGERAHLCQPTSKTAQLLRCQVLILSPTGTAPSVEGGTTALQARG